ncbi:MAG: hypothetical protein ABIW76_24300 [Fibrobacteria bacterium]
MRNEYMNLLRPLRGAAGGLLIGSMLAAAFLAGCAHRNPPAMAYKEVDGRSCREPDELLDVLTRFSTEVQAHRYHEAIARLVPEDQHRMVGKLPVP